MSPRTLRRWRAEDPAAPPARLGRPPLAPEQLEQARELVIKELERQGAGAGEEAVWRGLGCAIPQGRVRRVLREAKAELAGRRARHRERLRVSTEVLVRDALWAVDATHLGRDEHGAPVQAEVLREVASTRTLAASVGPQAEAEDVIRLLDAAVAARGGPPLVLLSDNGAAYTSRAVAEWCARRGVLQLFSLPRTPQHNAACEHGMREIKEDSGLGAGCLVRDAHEALRCVVESIQRIDGHRPRRTRGWRTAVEDDLRRPHWTTRVTRKQVRERVACRITPALLDSLEGRARRRAIREAILDALQELAIIKRTRGGRPWTLQAADRVC